MAVTGQRSFDDLGRSLHEVTFCVIDIETTGGTAADGGITEIGAVKLRGGERLGTFQTLVNPGLPIPPQITVLTGITQSMVLPAPHPEEVLPDLLEFVGDAVIVGHNVRYDLGYLNAALERSGRPRFPNQWVDTCALARRLVRDEVPNCRLGTLASRLGLPHRPTHRALDDALATGDLLHVLLERAAGFGVTGLDDLLTLPKIAGHPQVAKLTLTDGLPRTPGRLPVPRPGRPGALRRQGLQPAHPRALVLLGRRAAEGRASSCARSTASTIAPAAAASRRRCSRCASSTGSSPASTARPRAGGSTPTSSSPSSGSPGCRSCATVAARRRALPRPAAVDPRRAAGRRGDPDRAADPALHRPPGQPVGPVRGCADRRGAVPVRRHALRGRLPGGGRTPPPRPDRRPLASSSPSSASASTRWPPPSGSRRPPTSATGPPPSPTPSGASGAWTGCGGPGGC